MTKTQTITYWPEYYISGPWGWSRWFEGFSTIDAAERTIAERRMLQDDDDDSMPVDWRIAKVTTTTEVVWSDPENVGTP